MEQVQANSESEETFIIQPASVPAAPRGHNAWPEAHEAIFKQLYTGGGMSFSRIAVKLEELCGTRYTRSACVAKSHRMDLPRRGPRAGNVDSPTRIKRTAKQRPRKGYEWISTTAEAREAVKRIMRGKPSGGYYTRPSAPIEAPPSREIDLLALTGDTCRFPYGDGPFTFCGHPTHRSSSYCDAHARLTTISRANSFPCESPVHTTPPNDAARKIICSAADAVVSESA